MMKLNILLLCNKPKTSVDANTIIDHISAFSDYSRHNISLLSNVGDLPPKLDLEQFDGVIIHYSLSLINDYYISPDSRKRIRDYQGLKVLFIQDEYRQIDKIISEIDFLKINVLFTCFPEGEMERVYCKNKLPNLSKYSNLTGYIPERLFHASAVDNTANRPIDVGYRSRKVPFYLGELGYEKWNIVELWRSHVSDKELLKVDISYNESDRIYGEDWIKYLSSCKTVLGVESGASVMDFTGKLQTLIDFHQLTYPEDTFFTIQNIYLKEYEGKYYLNQISPRCFEAIALKTVLVLFEGEYSGILVPGRHYIMLKKDFSNIHSVLSLIKDNEFLQNMAEVTYNEIALNPKYSYKTFINKVDEVILSEFKRRNIVKVERYFIENISQNMNLNYNNSIVSKFEFELHNKEVVQRYYSYDKLALVNNLHSEPLKLSTHKKDLILKLSNMLIIKRVRYFVTHRLVVFNPLLRRMKKLVLRFS